MALVVSVQGAQTIEVYANAPEPAPSPTMATVKMVIVVVAAPQVPVATHIDPAGTSEAPEDAKAVQMTANAASSAPEPPWSLVIMVATPQMPVRANATPMALVIPV
jgi:hypothetical protein